MVTSFPLKTPYLLVFVELEVKISQWGRILDHPISCFFGHFWPLGNISSTSVNDICSSPVNKQTNKAAEETNAWKTPFSVWRSFLRRTEPPVFCVCSHLNQDSDPHTATTMSPSLCPANVRVNARKDVNIDAKKHSAHSYTYSSNAYDNYLGFITSQYISINQLLSFLLTWTLFFFSISSKLIHIYVTVCRQNRQNGLVAEWIFDMIQVD